MAEVASNVIDSRRLWLFYHVAKTGSLSRAEATIYVPQPAISRHISRLEDDLGVKLLERHGRGVRLTPMGEILYEQAEVILQEMSSTLDAIEIAKRRPIGRVSISASSIVMSRFMPEIVRRFIVKYPEVELTAIQAVSGQVYDQLVSNKVDVAIVMAIPNKHKFSLVKLLEEPMVLIASKDHPVASETVIRRASLVDLELALPASPNGMRNLIDSYFRDGNIDIAPHLQLDSVPLTAEMVADGRFATLMPISTFEHEFRTERFVGIPLKPAFSRTLYAAYAARNDEDESTHVNALIDEVVAVFQDQCPQVDQKPRTANKKRRTAKPRANGTT